MLGLSSLGCLDSVVLTLTEECEDLEQNTSSTLGRVEGAHFFEEVFVALTAFLDESLCEDLNGGKAVNAEATEVVAKFAPCDQGPDLAPEKQCHGAEAASGGLALLIAVLNSDDAFGLYRFANLDANRFQEIARYGLLRVARAEIWGVHADGVDTVTQLGCQHGLDLAKGVVSGGGQVGVSIRDDHAAAEDEGGNFASVKHKRWQVVVATESVADARLAGDGDAGELEVLDVAVNGAWGNFELLSQIPRRLQAAGAEELDDSEEAIGSTHDGDGKPVLEFPIGYPTPAEIGRARYAPECSVGGVEADAVAVEVADLGRISEASRNLSYFFDQ